MLHVSYCVGELRSSSRPRGEEPLRGNQNPSHAGLYRSQSAAWVTPEQIGIARAPLCLAQGAPRSQTPLSRQVLGWERLRLLGDLEGRLTPENRRCRHTPGTAVTDPGVFWLGWLRGLKKFFIICRSVFKHETLHLERILFPSLSDQEAGFCRAHFCACSESAGGLGSGGPLAHWPPALPLPVISRGTTCGACGRCELVTSALEVLEQEEKARG